MREVVNWCNASTLIWLSMRWTHGNLDLIVKTLWMESTPHLYLSALLFAPRDLFVSRKYLDRYPGLFTTAIANLSVLYAKTVSHTNLLVFWRRRLHFLRQTDVSPVDTMKANLYCLNMTQWINSRGWLVPELEMNVVMGGESCDIVFPLIGNWFTVVFCNGNIPIWNMRTRKTNIERLPRREPHNLVHGQGSTHIRLKKPGRYTFAATLPKKTGLPFTLTVGSTYGIIRNKSKMLYHSMLGGVWHLKTTTLRFKNTTPV